MKLFSKPKKKIEQRWYFKEDDIEKLLRYIEEYDKGGIVAHFRMWKYIYKAIPEIPEGIKVGLKVMAPTPYVYRVEEQ